MTDDASFTKQRERSRWKTQMTAGLTQILTSTPIFIAHRPRSPPTGKNQDFRRSLLETWLNSNSKLPSCLLFDHASYLCWFICSLQWYYDLSLKVPTLRFSSATLRILKLRHFSARWVDAWKATSNFQRYSHKVGMTAYSGCTRMRSSLLFHPRVCCALRPLCAHWKNNHHHHVKVLLLVTGVKELTIFIVSS